MTDRPTPLNDRWHSRDFPVLVEAARLIDQADELHIATIAHTLGIDADEVKRALSALKQAGYLQDGRITLAPSRLAGPSLAAPTPTSIELTERGRRAVGIWPSGQAADSLVDALRQAEDLVTDPEEKTLLRRAAGAMGSVSREVLTDVDGRRHQVPGRHLTVNASDGLTIVGFVITLGAAIVGWTWLRRADRRTAEALRLAQSAEDRAQRLEDQTVESRDVRWTAPIEENAWLSLRNAGTDAAHNVTVVVDSPHTHLPRRIAEFNSVAPNEVAAVNLETEVGETRRQAHERDPYSGAITWPTLILDVTVRWTSPNRVPGHQRLTPVHR